MRLAGILVVGLVACQPMSFVEVQNHRPHGVHVELALSDGSGRWALEIPAHGRGGVLFFPETDSGVRAHIDGLSDASDGYFTAGIAGTACFIVDDTIHPCWECDDQPATSCAVSQ